MIAVEAIQSFLGAEPEKAMPVLDAGLHRVVGKSILYLVMSEIIGLRASPRDGQQKTE